MQIEIKVGDLLDEQADVIVCTANPWLNMSGGVNGEILLRGGESVQEELHTWLSQSGKPLVEPGTVVVTGPGPVHARCLLHAVAIDAFYDSSVDVVRKTIENALAESMRRSALSVAFPALATGYGRLPMAKFAEALQQALRKDWPPLERLTVVVRRPEDALLLQNSLEK